ncbi:ParA family protein [Vibrio parahaemolyticus]|uniref:ParA family protein n=1 Tax=Vibrio parahaemolyticus TaxID=670 RepID=A0AAW8PZ33_VIBPH|nr:ParA family protein [Vibrio parahaemolyticus]EGR2229500.1 ParA family protein [Vibrio parahaemolyticus]MDS1820898.1 ParA family protein [Vibrio parahaemolyticus]
MSESLQCEGQTDLREMAYQAFRYCCKNNIITTSNTITDDRYWNYLDVSMVKQLHQDCGYVPPYIIEQARHLKTFSELNDVMGQLSEHFSRIRDEHGEIPRSLLHTFLYDYELFDSLKKADEQFEKKDSDVRVSMRFDEQMIVRLYGNDHLTMKRKVRDFISKIAKKRKWTNATRFHLHEVLALRDEFFSYIDKPSVNQRQSRVITVYTQKGGVGKSHITLSLAGALSLAINENKRVLVVDTDYQQSCTSTLVVKKHMGSEGYFNHRQSLSVFDLFRKYTETEPTLESLSKFKADCKSAVVETTLPNVDLLPASSDSSFDTQFSVGTGSGNKYIKPNALKVILDNICEGNQYDYILIDTRPDIHASAALSYYAGDEQVAILKPTGVDVQSFRNFARRMAIDVIPTLVSHTSEYSTPKRSRLIINQFLAQSQVQDSVVTILMSALQNTMYELMDVIVPNSTAATTCSAQEATIWNPAKNTSGKDDHKPLKAQRRVFSQLAMKIEYERMLEEEQQ